MINILFVCLGNICRSPMAQGIFENKVHALGLNSAYSADSAGTAKYHIGSTPDSRTIQTLANHTISLDHFGRQVTSRDAEVFDHIVAMDHSNYDDLKQILPSDFQGLHLMRAFDPENRNADVPDPYYGGIHDFETVYRILDRSMTHFLDFLETRA